MEVGRAKVIARYSSIGVDRLLAALEHLGRFEKRKSTSRVLVTNMDPALTDEYLAMTFELRRAGIPSEMYLAKAGPKCTGIFVMRFPMNNSCQGEGR